MGSVVRLLCYSLMPSLDFGLYSSLNVTIQCPREDKPVRIEIGCLPLFQTVYQVRFTFPLTSQVINLSQYLETPNIKLQRKLSKEQCNCQSFANVGSSSSLPLHMYHLMHGWLNLPRFLHLLPGDE